MVTNRTHVATLLPRFGRLFLQRRNRRSLDPVLFEFVGLIPPRIFVEWSDVQRRFDGEGRQLFEICQ